MTDTTVASAPIATDQVVPLNALGQPSPGRTDFAGWSRAGLEQFAREAADENLVLKAQLKDLQANWRSLVIEAEDLRQEANYIALNKKAQP